MLNNIKISKRLSIYSSILIIAIITCSATGYFGIKNVYKNQEEITNIKLPGLNLLRKASIDIHQAIVAELMMSIFSDNPDDASKHLKVYKKNIRQSRERIEKLLNLGDIQSSDPMLINYTRARKEWMALADNIVQQMANGNIDNKRSRMI